MNRTAIAIAIIVLCGLAAYANSFDGVFTFDDTHTIRDNNLIRLPSPWPLISQGGLQSRPVLGLTFWLNYWAGGLNVWGYHATNLAIHLLAAVMVFLVVRRTLALVGPDRLGLSLAVAVLWVVHPLTTTAVTYIVQRAESMMALFYLASLYCFIRAHGVKGLGWVFLSVLCAFLAVGTKQVAATIPVMCLLYDHIFLTGSWRRALRDKWHVYIGLLASWTMMAPYLFAWSSMTVGTEVLAGTIGIGRWGYFITQTTIIAHYLDVAIWPRLVSIDPFFLPLRSFWDIGTAGFITLALVAATVWAFFRKSIWVFLGVWIFVILLPTSSVLPMQDAGFDYRFYLPLVAVIVAAVFAGRWLMFRLVNWLIGGAGGEGGCLRVLFCGMAVVLVATLFATETARQNRFYRSEMDLWLHVVRQDPSNPRGHLQVGAEYHKMGEADLVRAMDIAERAGKETDPDKTTVLAREAGTLREQGIQRILIALEAANEAVRIYPYYMEAYNNRSRAKAVLGDFKGALADAETAIRSQKSGRFYVPAIINCANAHLFLGEMDKALEYYDAAEKLKPDDPLVYHNRATVWVALGRLDMARADCEKSRALGMEPAEKVLEALEKP
jgi:tetratricopeptide (TPR) repeat protein